MTHQPSASEWRMLRSLAWSLAQQAATTGESRAQFRGFRLSARRLRAMDEVDGAYVELQLSQDGWVIDCERAWIH